MNESVTQSESSGEDSHRLMSNLRLVSLGTIVSRILGLIRDIGMTSAFGAGTVLDAFIVAFRIPNLARQLLGEGALTTAFLPVFVRCRNERGDQSARELMTALAIAVFLILSGLIFLIELILMGIWLTMTLSPASHLLVQLLAVMLPYSLLICLSALFCGALHAQRRFLWPVIVPITLNIVWLIALGLAIRFFSIPFQQALMCAWAVLLAGFIQLTIPLFALKHLKMGVIQSWRNGWPLIGTVFLAMLPVVVGMSLVQSAAVVDSLLAWGLSQPDDGSLAWCESIGIPPLMESGTASALYIGQRMYQFPLGVFGIALGTVLFPVLTQHAQRGEMNLLRVDLSRGIRIMLAVALPASAGLVVTAWPLTLALFKHGEFNLEDAKLTSRMIAIYGSGVWCYIGVAILNRAFYATDDRITPMRLGFVSLMINMTLNLIFIVWLGGVGMALGSVIASAIQLLLTTWKLNRHVGPLMWDSILTTLWKGVFATAAMTTASLGVISLLPTPTNMLSKLIFLGVPCLTGSACYLLLAWVMGMTELQELLTRTPASSDKLAS